MRPKFTPKRVLTLLLTLTLFSIWNGWFDLIDLISYLTVHGAVVSFSFPFGAGIEMPANQTVFSPAFKFLLCFLASILIVQSGSRAIAAEIRSADELEKTLEIERERRALSYLIDQKSGIKRIFQTNPNRTILRQAYASPIRTEVENSKTLRLLTIAGFEYIGRKHGSLLYDLIAGRPELDVEIMLLEYEHPNGKKVVDERMKALRERDVHYTPERFIENIRVTLQVAIEIEEARKGNVGSLVVRTVPFHPVFRLLVLDHCLFLSTYERGRHGHESPVYKIDALSEGAAPDDVSLYDSFCRFYENVRVYSNEVPKQAGC